MKPEVKTEIMLSSWLQTNNIPVWYNRKIKELNNQNIFKVQGESRKKPDMVIYSKILNKYGAIEIKPTTFDKTIYSAAKIITTYLKEYKENKIKYYIEGKEININFFIIATKFSIDGHLFESEDKSYPNDEGWHYILQKTKNEPPYEYNKSKQFLRQLWDEWRRNNRGKFEPGIGILLSSCLDGIESKPKIFYQTYEYNIRKRKIMWNVRWREI